MIDWRRWLWEGRREGTFDVWRRVVSLLFAPLEWGYRGAVATRGWAYSSGLLGSRLPGIPTLAVGNLTVGGTGKTPTAAWLVGELRRRARHPALVTRGYGEDEVQVHRVLNPDVPVIVSVKRIVGVSEAIARGADVAVLDDAFQHRALEAHAYLVLLAAEEWTERPRLLPRGPWREPLSALERSTLTVVTRKSASREAADRVRARLAERRPGGALAQIHLRVSHAYRYDDGVGLEIPGIPLAGFRASVGVAGVARPEEFWAQLEEVGAEVDTTMSFPDHHRYRDADVSAITHRATDGAVLATLKDAVKLRNLMADDIDIYVPLQELEWEAGRSALEALLADVMREGAEVQG